MLEPGFHKPFDLMWRLNDTAQKSYPPPQAEWNLQLFVPTRNRVGSGYRANNGITTPPVVNLGECTNSCSKLPTQTHHCHRHSPRRSTPNLRLASATCQCRLVLPHFQSLQPLKSYLPDLLHALQQQHVPVEVVIVDDGSPRLMQKLLGRWTRRLAEQYPNLLPCILLEQNYGKGFAIRKGWSHAADPIQILAFVDADGSVPASSVAEQLLQSLEHPDQLRCGVRPATLKGNAIPETALDGQFFSLTSSAPRLVSRYRIRSAVSKWLRHRFTGNCRGASKSTVLRLIANYLPSMHRQE